MKEKLAELDILNPNAWVEDGRWIQTPFAWALFTYWHKTDVAKRILPSLQLDTIFNIDGYAFHNVHSRKQIYEHLKQRFNENTLKTYTDIVDKEGREVFKKVLAEIDQDDAYVENNIETVMQAYIEFIGFWCVIAFSGDQITLLAKDTGYVATDADLFPKVHPYLRETWIEEEVKDIRAIAQKYLDKNSSTAPDDIANAVEKDTELSELLGNYIKKFTWSRISKWVGEPLGKDYALKRLAEEVNNVVQKNNIPIHHADASDVGFDGVVALCVCAAYWRAECARVEMIMADRMRVFLKSIAARNGIEYQQVLLLTPGELISVFKTPGTIISNKEKVLSRAKVFFNTLSKDGEEIILTPDDAEYAAIHDVYLKRHYETAGRPTSLKGIGASKGKVSGTVRVIESSQQFDTFKDGEILVAAETSPTFVPLMRMSAAILTGKGGITSHAAIVSRELKKPCIIAIKDVTRILKTGDMIEVDADKGIVTISN